MKFKEYMEQVENKLNQMSKEEMYEWIYQEARTINEKKREHFLECLNPKMEEIIVDWDKIKDMVGKIESEVYTIECNYSDYYDSWDDEEDDEYEYEDTHNICTFIEILIKKAQSLMNQKQYTEACQLYQILFHLKVAITGDDYEQYDLADLTRKDLISPLFEDVMKSYVYCLFQSKKGQPRVKAITDVLFEHETSIMITDVLSSGPEKLLDTDAFFKLWIKKLEKQEGTYAEKLLLEAIECYDENLLYTKAKENINKFPLLMKQCVHNAFEEKDDILCVSLGKETLQLMDSQLKIKSEILDMALVAAKRSNTKEVNAFLLESFKSYPDMKHFLRLFVEGTELDVEKIKKEVKMLPTVNYRVGYHFSFNTQYILSKDMVLLYQVMLNDIDLAIEYINDHDNYLGWSTDIKGKLILLLLLWIMPESLETKNAGVLSNFISQISEYGETETIKTMFMQWKKQYSLVEEKINQCLPVLIKEVDKRCEAVVGGGHRNSYWKVAQLIIALNDMLNYYRFNAKKYDLIHYYEGKHSRKRAFRDCLTKMNLNGNYEV